MEKLRNRAPKKNQILHCEWCGKPLHLKKDKPVDHGKMKVCQTCHIDLNWFKSELHDKPRLTIHTRNKAVARVNG